MSEPPGGSSGPPDLGAVREIALREVVEAIREGLRIEDGRDVRVNAYGLRQPVEECWVVYVPQPSPHDGYALRSSNVVLISSGRARSFTMARRMTRDNG